MLHYHDMVLVQRKSSSAESEKQIENKLIANFSSTKIIFAKKQSTLSRGIFEYREESPGNTEYLAS